MKLFLILLCIGLAGCAQYGATDYESLSRLDPYQLQTSDDYTICAALYYVKFNLNYKAPDFDRKIINESKRRDLKTCSDGELYCRSLGVNYGDPGYPQCKSQYDERAAYQALIIRQQNMQADQFYTQQQNQSYQAYQNNLTQRQNNNYQFQAQPSQSQTTRCRTKSSAFGGSETVCNQG